MAFTCGMPSISVQVRLLLVIAISTCFLITELAVGFKTHSLALIADAFHYTGDLLSFVIAYLAQKHASALGRDVIPEEPGIELEAAENRTAIIRIDQKDGRHVLPLLAAFFNSVFLLALGLAIFLQGLEKFVHLDEIANPQLVLIIGCVGILTNVVCAGILGADGHHHHGHSHGHSHSHDHGDPHAHSHEHHHDIRSDEEKLSHGTALSIKAVLLHVAADALNNLAVIVSAAIIWKVPTQNSPEDRLHHDSEHNHYGSPHPKYYADPACTVFIAILIMASTGPVVLQSGRALVAAATGTSVQEILSDTQSKEDKEEKHKE
ncbi:zinc/cadmium resistance protein [Trichophyton mentagrophytes]|nr:zinc/cadmium resistance protein [Trichophyton mentagrophytes]